MLTLRAGHAANFGRLLRAYISQLRTRQILSAISVQGFRTAREIAKRQYGGNSNDASLSTSTSDKWQQIEISYPLWYGDYGGTARVDFYVKDVGRYRLVMVFMGGDPKERDSILNSVEIPAQ